MSHYEVTREASALPLYMLIEEKGKPKGKKTMEFKHDGQWHELLIKL